MISDEIIRLEDVSKIYGVGGSKIAALDKVNLLICKGECISIMGPSGSGKTTLLDIVSTMSRPTSGKIFIEGKETTKMTNNELAQYRGQKIGFIFQSFNLLSKLSALENVMVPMWVNGIPRNKREQKARKLLEMVELSDRLNNKPGELSGGQKQRVAIARALALDPNIIVADEPTGNLDTKSGENVMEIINSLHKDAGKTIILVTHDQEIGDMAENKITIRDGQVTGDRKVCPIKKVKK
jgi:putative ABC transport system ATP-binding protein